MKRIIILGLCAAIFSSCGIRKVAMHSRTTKTDSTAVHTSKSDSTVVNVIKTETEQKQTEHIVDTTKMVSENKTVVEFFSLDGKLVKRITSNTKKQKNTAKFNFKVDKRTVFKRDSTFLTSHSELKDSTVLASKNTVKAKETTAKRPKFWVFGLLIAAIAILVIIYNRKPHISA